MYYYIYFIFYFFIFLSIVSVLFCCFVLFCCVGGMMTQCGIVWYCTPHVQVSPTATVIDHMTIE